MTPGEATSTARVFTVTRGVGTATRAVGAATVDGMTSTEAKIQVTGLEDIMVDTEAKVHGVSGLADATLGTGTCSLVIGSKDRLNAKLLSMDATQDRRKQEAGAGAGVRTDNPNGGCG